MIPSVLKYNLPEDGTIVKKMVPSLLHAVSSEVVFEWMLNISTFHFEYHPYLVLCSLKMVASSVEMTPSCKAISFNEDGNLTSIYKKELY